MREPRETRCPEVCRTPADSVRGSCYPVAVRGSITGKGATHHIIHRGRHAWPEDLERLVRAIGAQETIWVHTDRAVTD